MGYKWKNSKYLNYKKIQITKEIVSRVLHNHGLIVAISKSSQFLKWLADM